MKSKHLFVLLFSITFITTSCSSKPTSQNIASTPEDITQVLPHQPKPINILPCSREMSEFEDTGKTLGNSGSAGKVYKDKKEPTQEYFIKEDWNEAYASTVFRFFLGVHSQEVCFITEPGKVYAAIKLEPTFKSAEEYHLTDNVGWFSLPLIRPMLPGGHGLGGIIVASKLLAEIDLKGFSSDKPNFGVITNEGREIYYKIDCAQSLYFNSDHNNNDFRLDDLKLPDASMPYLTKLALSAHLDSTHFKEIQGAAITISQTPRDSLEKVLDYCEDKLKVLPGYPDKQLPTLADNVGVFATEAPPTTYKEAILRRFDKLVDAVK